MQDALHPLGGGPGPRDPGPGPHKIHAAKIQGRVFSEVVEAPQAAATQTQRAGNPETDNYCRLSQGNLDN